MCTNNKWEIGSIDKRVIQLIGISVKEGTPIIIGEQNILHMKSRHPDDYDKYGEDIADIIANPSYVAKHPKGDSIEYIKEYSNSDNDHVLVAVRVTGNGTYFARTLFVMSEEKKDKYRIKGAFNPY